MLLDDGDGRTDRRMDRPMDGRTDGWMDGWMDGRTDEWIDESMDGLMDRWIDVYVHVKISIILSVGLLRKK